MTATDILSSLTPTQSEHLKLLHKNYKGRNVNRLSYVFRMAEYLMALRDCGIITEVDRKRLFCYFVL